MTDTIMAFIEYLRKEGQLSDRQLCICPQSITTLKPAPAVQKQNTPRRIKPFLA